MKRLGDAANLGDGPSVAMTIPWGDVVTAYYSTGIGNIEAYMAAPWGTRVAARLSRSLGWLLGNRSVQRWLVRRVEAGPAGPTEEGEELSLGRSGG